MSFMERFSRGRHLVDPEDAASNRTLNEPVQARSKLPAVPVTMHPHVVFQPEAGTVHVDGRYAGAAAFLTWLEDIRAAGFEAAVEPVTPQELAHLKERVGSQEGNEKKAYLDNLELSRRRHMDAAALGAEDLHVLQRERHTEFQLRIDGELWTVPDWELTPEQGATFVRATCSGLATVKIENFSVNEYQDAQIAGSALPGMGITSVRIARGPCYPMEADGAFMINRLQYHRHGERTEEARKRREALDGRLRLEVPEAPAGAVDFLKLGFTPLQARLFEEIIRTPEGIFFQTGPTGAGKTTTHYEMLRYKAQVSPELRQVTIEAPVEYPMEWAVQLLGTNLPYDYLVSRTLRQDPDVISVAEVRTADEGVAAIQAAQTGHLVLATLHEVDPYETVSRLEMLDHIRLSRRMICNHKVVIGFMAQRMIPILCNKCKEPLSEHPDDVPAYLLERVRTWGDIDKVHVRGRGCSVCKGRKTIGRRPVAEIVLASEDLMDDFLRHDINTARRNHRLREGSDKSMLAHAMDKVLAGDVGISDAQKQIAIESYREGR